MNPANNRSAGAQARACHQAAAFYAKRQSGPRPGSREAVFLAGLLENAEATLLLVERHRDAFLAIVKGGEK